MSKKKQEAGPLKVPQPVAGRVVILPIAKETQLPSGIVLPEGASDAPSKGTVLAVDSKRKPEESYVEVGDLVLYSSYSQVFKIDETEFVIVPEREVIAIL